MRVLEDTVSIDVLKERAGTIHANFRERTQFEFIQT